MKQYGVLGGDNTPLLYSGNRRILPWTVLLCFANELTLSGTGPFNALQGLGYTSATLFEENKKDLRTGDHPRE